MWNAFYYVWMEELSAANKFNDKHEIKWSANDLFCISLVFFIGQNFSSKEVIVMFKTLKCSLNLHD